MKYPLLQTKLPFSQIQFSAAFIAVLQRFLSSMLVGKQGLTLNSEQCCIRDLLPVTGEPGIASKSKGNFWKSHLMH